MEGIAGQAVGDPVGAADPTRVRTRGGVFNVVLSLATVTVGIERHSDLAVGGCRQTPHGRYVSQGVLHGWR